MNNSEIANMLKTIIQELNTIKSAYKTQEILISELSDNNRQHQYLLNHGIEGFKEMVVEKFKKQSKENKINRLYSYFMHDKDLSHPHKKILCYLLDQYDYNKNSFSDIHFSKLVKDCKIGKNKAKEYLDLLADKGFVERTEDGYRVWYCISEDHLPKGEG